jgi:hypothetical protein
MGLREQAEADLGLILEDKDRGFGYDIILTDPSGTVRALTGFSDDIAQIIDPDTGIAVSGRLASVAIRTSTIIAAGLTLPRGIADAGIKPWLVQFNDINGNPFTFKVSQSNPDRALGLVTLMLELYVV